MVAVLAAGAPSSLFSEKESLVLDGKIFELEPFVIYEAPIPVKDGITGDKYTGTNPIVLDFADSFNDLLLKYHKKLLIHEIEHLNFRVQDGPEFEKDLAALADSFGIKKFKVDHRDLLIKEKAILHRLNQDPFFKIDALIAWDLDQLNRMLPAKPKTKYAKDIRYNEQTGQWERRVTTEWDVKFVQRNQNGQATRWVNVHKEQGLNLDTNEGYHFIDRGLTNHVHPDAFSDVKLTYPILVSSTEPRAIQVKRLQDTLVQNLYYIYDPFSWVARRNTRFRGGFYNDLQTFFRSSTFRVRDMDWFKPVLCRFLSDVITVKRHGTKEIYSLYAEQRFHLSPNILGTDLDLLNWNRGEKREGEHNGKTAKVWINYDSPGGARFIMLDAYMRYSNKFVDALRTNLSNLKRKTSGKDVVRKTIEEISGVPFDVYVKNAIKAQKQMIEKYR